MYSLNGKVRFHYGLTVCIEAPNTERPVLFCREQRVEVGDECDVLVDSTWQHSADLTGSFHATVT